MTHFMIRMRKAKGTVWRDREVCPSVAILVADLTIKASILPKG